MATTETSAVSMRARVWVTNSSSDPSRMGRGSTMAVAPQSQVAWMAVTSGRDVGPSRATRLPGPTPRRCRPTAMRLASRCSSPQGTRTAAAGSVPTKVTPP